MEAGGRRSVGSFAKRTRPLSASISRAEAYGPSGGVAGGEARRSGMYDDWGGRFAADRWERLLRATAKLDCPTTTATTSMQTQPRFMFTRLVRLEKYS